MRNKSGAKPLPGMILLLIAILFTACGGGSGKTDCQAKTKSSPTSEPQIDFVLSIGNSAYISAKDPENDLCSAEFTFYCPPDNPEPSMTKRESDLFELYNNENDTYELDFDFSGLFQEDWSVDITLIDEEGNFSEIHNIYFANETVTIEGGTTHTIEIETTGATTVQLPEGTITLGPQYTTGNTNNATGLIVIMAH